MDVIKISLPPKTFLIQPA